MFVFWIVWSGQFDLFHLALGVISTAIVSLWSSRLFFPSSQIRFSEFFATIFRVECYGVWLVYQIFLANLDVLRLALHPRCQDMLDPKMVSFKTTLRSEMALFVFAQSITLTPGTVTVRVSDHEFLVHALSPMFAKGLPGDMQDRIARAFKEDV